MNVLTELNDALQEVNKTVEDIKAIQLATSKEYGYETTDHTSHKELKATTEIEAKLQEWSDITYHNGYGSQELFGAVLFKDNTWLSRGEYDGSEWWEYNKPPTVEEIIGE